MAEKIARQFKALAAAAETDQAVLSSVDTPRIVATVLDRMREVCACDLVGVTLLDARPAARRRPTSPIPIDPTAPRAYVAQFRRDDANRLLRKPQGFTLRNEAVPPYLAPLGECGGPGRAHPAAHLPGRTARRHRAGRVPFGRRADEDELKQAERVAGQVVLALANARMVDQIRFLAYFDSLTGLPNRVSFKRGSRRNWSASACSSGGWPSASSTSITSAASTTRWATGSATAWCRRWRTGSRLLPEASRRQPRWRGWAATSSP